MRVRGGAATLALCLSGCGFLLVRGPSATDDPARPLECTSSMAGPVVDGILAAPMLALAVAFAAGCSEDAFIDCRPLAIPPAIVGVSFLLSALAGGSKIHRCRDAERRHQEFLAGGRGAISNPELAWSCSDGGSPKSGVCFRSPSACAQLRDKLSKRGYGECHPAETAYCLALESPEGRRLTCHPSMAACQTQRDLARSRGARVSRECASNW